MFEDGYRDWLLDATLYDEADPDMACFTPYDSATGALLVGVNMLASRCPGRLVGVCHADGDAAADAWLAAHPDAKERFGQRS